MSLKSLDPRINRLEIKEQDQEFEKDSLDQLTTFEVFIQPREDRPYQHEGIVHAPDEDMAFVFAKEQFSRRATCSGMKITDTRNVYVSKLSEAGVSIYESIEAPKESNETETEYLVFHLMKRGKQHRMAGEVLASGPEDALYKAKLSLDPGKPVLNAWVVRTANIHTTSGSDKVIWDTLPDKTFREAIAYRGADKIKKFLEEQS